jgi:hypothetical protein
MGPGLFLSKLHPKHLLPWRRQANRVFVTVYLRDSIFRDTKVILDISKRNFGERKLPHSGSWYPWERRKGRTIMIFNFLYYKFYGFY